VRIFIRKRTVLSRNVVFVGAPGYASAGRVLQKRYQMLRAGLAIGQRRTVIKNSEVRAGFDP
ncbi:MAG: hypothetical protein WCA20_34180, partial [Candidatus Sulfotelmatobacter sp.]